MCSSKEVGKNRCLKLGEAAREILDLYPTLPYDHRKFITYREPHEHIRLRDATEEYRIQYACFKYAVAQVLKIDMMMEIGVRFGCSALAFLNARPNARYLGLDNERDSKLDCCDYLSYARKSFEELKLKATVLIGDSQQVYLFPSVDFIHIDGCHSRECTHHDVLTALCSEIPWVLVDDSNTASVSEGIEDALVSALKLNIRATRWNFLLTQGGDTLLRLEEGK